MGIYGQDWSGFQSGQPSVAGLSFAFIKVTEGLSYINPMWVKQRDWAKQNNLVVGFYAYPHMGNSYISEANYFLSQVNWQPGDIAILDWEGYDTNNANVSKATQAAYKDSWLRYVKGKLPNNPVGVYCNTDYWNNVDKTGYCADFLWIATAGKPAGSPGIAHSWLFHQYGDTPVDKDYCPLPDTAALRAWTLNFNSTTPGDIVLQADINAIAKATADLLVSVNYRDALTFSNLWWLDQVFSMKPMAGSSANVGVVNDLQKELGAIFGKLDPSVVTQLQTAIQNTLKSTAITATVEVNGVVK